MEQYCDNRSVGIILTNDKGELALLNRGRFPVGIAPAAGHIDAHGSPEQAAVDELSEELGIRISVDDLARTSIYERHVKNTCRRVGGNHHVWSVYEASIADADLTPDPHETNGAEWYEREIVHLLARRTKAYLNGTVSQAEWVTQPGLEPVWADFLEELGYIR